MQHVLHLQQQLGTVIMEFLKNNGVAPKLTLLLSAQQTKRLVFYAHQQEVNLGMTSQCLTAEVQDQLYVV